jgi:hypothetical protein
MRTAVLTAAVAAVVISTQGPVAAQVDSTIPADGSFLQVVSPNGGETWHAGDTVTIEWLAVDSVAPVACVRLVGGEETHQITGGCINMMDPQWEAYTWVVPAGVVPGSEYRIAIDNYMGDIRDTSDAPFTIGYAQVDSTVPAGGGLLELLSPNGGEVWQVGDTVTIAFLAVDTLVPYVDIAIKYNAGEYSVLIGVVRLGDAGWENFRWVVSAAAPLEEYCWIVLDDYGGPAGDESRRPFIILPATPTDTTYPTNGKIVEVISPNGGEVFHVGDTMPVVWHALDAFYQAAYASIQLEGPNDVAGLQYVILGGGNPFNPGDAEWEYQTWVIPERMPDNTPLAGTTARLRAHNYMNEAEDWSDGEFTILAAQNAAWFPVPRMAGNGVAAARMGAGTLVLDLSAAGSHRVELYTAAGTLLLRREGAGPARYEVPTRSMSGGLYLLRVLSAGNAATYPLVLTK